MPPRDPGFTLAEMLTVIAIIALIGGLGAGAFQMARRSYSLSASAGRIQGIIRAARNSALRTGGAAFVVIDPVRKTLAAHVFEPVGEWSFDGVTGLAREREGGASTGAAPGRIGHALDAGTGGHVDAGSGARFDLRSSVFIAAWVRHSGFDEVKELPGERGRRSGAGSTPSRRRSLAAARRSGPARLDGRKRLAASDGRADSRATGTILGKKGAYFLGMTASGALEAAIGDYRVRTLEPVVPPGQWVHVTLRYDGLVLELSADGVPRPWRVAGRASVDSSRADRDRLPPVAPLTSAPVTISAPEAPFPGLIDEVQLAGAAEPLAYRYSDFEHIIGWKKVIRFDRRGHLDRLRHEGPVRILLVELEDEAAAPATTEVVVDYSVTFEEWRSQWESPPDDLTEAGEEAKLEGRLRTDGRIAITVERLGSVTSARLESEP